MRILGVDCGSLRTGVGIIESDGKAHSLVHAGTIHTKASWAFGTRLKTIYDELLGIISAHQPDVAAIEDIFSHANVQSALKLAHVRGVAMLAIAEARIPCNEYSPNAIKLSVVGYGKAQKNQVQHMVRTLLKIPEAPISEDAADALAAAVCCAVHHRFPQ
ncbi:MAG: crossover junction endodeoxyribonuclease RuvC [Bryobacterales bacterium]|nr:crossover junction endodeoxyribonuclease RuvC [Bryobacterales bacterium]